MSLKKHLSVPESPWVQHGPLAYKVDHIANKLIGTIQTSEGPRPATVKINAQGPLPTPRVGALLQLLNTAKEVTLNTSSWTIELKGRLLGGGGGASKQVPITEQSTMYEFDDIRFEIPPYQKRPGIPFNFPIFDIFEQELMGSNSDLSNPSHFVQTYAKPGLSIFENPHEKDVYLLSYFNYPVSKFYLPLCDLDTTQKLCLAVEILSPESNFRYERNKSFIRLETLYTNPTDEPATFLPIPLDSVQQLNLEAYNIVKKSKVFVLYQTDTIRNVVSRIGNTPDSFIRNISTKTQGEEPTLEEKLSWLSPLLGKVQNTGFQPRHRGLSEGPLASNGKNTVRLSPNSDYVGLWENGYPHGPGFKIRNTTSISLMMFDSGRLYQRERIDLDPTDSKTWTVAELIKAMPADDLRAITSIELFRAWLREN